MGELAAGVLNDLSDYHEFDESLESLLDRNNCQLMVMTIHQSERPHPSFIEDDGLLTFIYNPRINLRDHAGPVTHTFNEIVVCAGKQLQASTTLDALYPSIPSTKYTFNTTESSAFLFVIKVMGRESSKVFVPRFVKLTSDDPEVALRVHGSGDTSSPTGNGSGPHALFRE